MFPGLPRLAPVMGEDQQMSQNPPPADMWRIAPEMRRAVLRVAAGIDAEPGPEVTSAFKTHGWAFPFAGYRHEGQPGIIVKLPTDLADFALGQLAALIDRHALD